jgi:hypothetical protein
VATDEAAGQANHGRVLDVDDLSVTGAGSWAVVDATGELLAVHQRHRGTTAKPGVVLVAG